MLRAEQITLRSRRASELAQHSKIRRVRHLSRTCLKGKRTVSNEHQCTVVELAVVENELGTWRNGAVHGCMIVDDRGRDDESCHNTPKFVEQIESSQLLPVSCSVTLLLVRLRVPRHQSSIVRGKNLDDSGAWHVVRRRYPACEKERPSSAPSDCSCLV